MDRRAELKGAGRKMTENHFPSEGMPIKAYSGSLGDPHGYIHEKSDIDVEAWVTNNEYIRDLNKPVIDWQPYKWKWKTRIEGVPLTDIDVVSDVEGKYDASIAFMFIDKDKIPIMSEELIEGFKDSDPLNYYSPLDFALRHFSETELIEDSTGIYDKLRSHVNSAFYDRRKDLAERALNDKTLRFLFHKLEDDVDIVKSKGELDITQYNMKATNIINRLTFGNCCIVNIPKSFHSIQDRRKTNLWRALGMDEKQINRAMISSEDHTIDAEKAQNSLQTLKQLTKELLDKAKNRLNMSTACEVILSS